MKMRSKDKKWARSSLLISVAIHGVIFIFLTIYVIGTNTRVKEFVNTILVPESKPQEYEPKPQPVRPVVRPTIPQVEVVSTDAIPVTVPKRSSPAPGRPSVSKTPFRSMGDPQTQSLSPSDLARNRIAPKVSTAADVPRMDSSLPEMKAGGIPGQGGTSDRLGDDGGMGAGGSGRSRIGSPMAEATKPESLSITRADPMVDIADNLTEVMQGVSLGKTRVPPLIKGEPGGRVIGRGKDIEGHIRFTRIKHLLADWWADPTSMSGIVRWMNTQTKIQSDMNIEGGALTLDDPKLLKCPLAIMTGHDRAILTGNIQGNYRYELSQQERSGLRRYLIESRGLLFFDECGHDIMLARHLKSELRNLLPEYGAELIPNDHELYSCYYDLGGPPPGAYRFWKHGSRTPDGIVGKNLEGIFIKGDLVAIISTRDYLCAARTKNRPGHGNTGEESPSTYRFLTNLIIYSLTHGGISDYTNYVPDLSSKDSIGIDTPVKVPLIPQ
jgi:hypothetical protein